MCGISGIVEIKLSKTEFYKLAETLLLELETRGKDATGIYTAGRVKKAPIKASDFIKFLPRTFGTVTLLHNRAATKGSEWDNNNNHPVFGDEWVLIHNGILTMEKLKDYSYMGEVDSEILLSHIEKHGLETALGELEGSAAVAVTRIDSDSVFLWRNSAPIYLGYVPRKCFMFASTEDALTEASNKVFGRKCLIFPKVSVACLKSEALVEMNPRGIKLIKTIEPKQKSKISQDQYWAYDKRDQVFYLWKKNKLGVYERTSESKNIDDFYGNYKRNMWGYDYED